MRRQEKARVKCEGLVEATERRQRKRSSAKDFRVKRRKKHARGVRAPGNEKTNCWDLSPWELTQRLTSSR